MLQVRTPVHVRFNRADFQSTFSIPIYISDKVNPILNENLLIFQIGIIAIAVFLRCAIGFKYKIGQDTWVYLLIADIIRKKRGLPDQIDNFIYVGSFGYPPLFPSLLSVIPEKVLERFVWIISPVIEAVHIVLIYFICLFITQSPEVGLIAMFLYAIHPEMVIETSNLNTRPLSSLIFTVSLVSLIFFVITGNPLLFLSCIVFGVLLLYTHKLATQALFITLMGFTLIERNPIYAIAAVLIFGIAYLTPWYRKKVLPEHVAILQFWKKNIKLVYERGITSEVNGENKGSLINFLRSRTVLFLRFVGSNMWFLFIAIMIFLFNRPLLYPEVLYPVVLFFTWACIIFLCSLIIGYIPYVKFLGEGLRYQEYAIVPTIILAAIYFNKFHDDMYVTFLFIGVIGILLVEMVMGLYYSVTKYIRLSPGTGIIKICSYLRSAPGKNIMCLPIDTSFMIAYFTRKNVLYAFSTHAYEKAYPEALFGDPRKKSLHTLIEKYSIDYIYVDSTFFLPEELDLGTVETIMVEDGYYLLQVKRNT